MDQPLSERFRLALREFIEVSAYRARTETEVEAGFKERKQATEESFAEAKARIEDHFQALMGPIESEIEQARQDIPLQFQEEQDHLQNEWAQAKNTVEADFQANKEKVEADFKESRWTILTLLEADKKVARDQLHQAQTKVANALKQIGADEESAIKILQSWQLDEEIMERDPELGELGELESGNPFDALSACRAAGSANLALLKKLTLPRYLIGWWPHFAAVAVWVVLAVATPFLPWTTVLLPWWFFWLVGISVGVPLTFKAIMHLLKREVHRTVAKLWLPIRQAVLEAAVLREICLTLARKTYREQRTQSQKVHKASMEKAAEKAKQKVRELGKSCAQEVQQLEKKYQKLLEQSVSRRDQQLLAAEQKYQKLSREYHLRRDRDLAQAQADYQKRVAENQQRHRSEWSALVQVWKEGCNQFQNLLEEVQNQCRSWFPPWDDPIWQNWPAAADIPWALQFGRIDVKPERIAHGIPKHSQLPRLEWSDGPLPALLPFPERSSFLFKAADKGRDAAIQTLQALLLRCWTALPPGKVRCTIIDPVGRGENFAAFMHLADHDESLITSRIWTESSHIDQRLQDLTAHMENVLQKYLRNQYKSLAEYNAQAGEMAEPFRFLVVANFPVNFGTDAARRLISLASSGARCGIYTLILADTRQPLPQGVEMADLEQACINLTWRGDKFHWEDPDFGPFPLQLDSPPVAEFCSRVLDGVGERAKEASKVEVPFDAVAPAVGEWWTQESRSGILVPLGRAGATSFQQLNLGSGTAQHVLIAGKTGSGKSTLLHALITQLALRYSPDEVELYLIDFKKGVEFKTYAAHHLPHARVVAVESEREFGLSVLQRLDAELVRRGEAFRAAGVNDLPSFRQAQAEREAQIGEGGAQNPGSDSAPRSALSSPLSPMPRVLLIVDEFQEFFVEDDKTAQEAALLMDRLVRQGRAFGIHIILGSQTLGGAFSLARTTLDQMAVRIALQCSEADAHLILSKENSDARLLSRPGEAIYNAAGGLLEGNSLFQVVWLNDNRRDDYLNGVRKMAEKRHYQPPFPQIVFEGTAPAELQKNPFLSPVDEAALLRRDEKHSAENRHDEKRDEGRSKAASSTRSGQWQAWLGDAVAIKDPTTAVFRKQSGCNLLIIGQNGEAAFNLMTAAMASLCAERGAPSVQRETQSAAPPNSELAAPRSPLHAFNLVVANPLEEEADVLCNQLPEIFPLNMVMPRELPDLLNRLAEEVDRRTKGSSGQESAIDQEPIFLFLHGLQRLRDLRRSEDDFGFSKKDDKPNPSKQFIHLAREGPPVGIFTIVWCDNLNNLQRSLDRQALREFEMRVLFQMSANDSSNLIDSPLASKLGPYRALYYTEDQGKMEKFRPYGLPAVDWLRTRFAKGVELMAAETESES